MRKQYKVTLMVNCGGNYYDAVDFKKKCLSLGFTDDEIILVPKKDISDHYTVFIVTTSDIKKKLIKYFKLEKDVTIYGTPMRDGYKL